MAPTSEDLHDLVHKLEARVKELEARIESGAKSALPTPGVRMILIGPPGAGTFLAVRSFNFVFPWPSTNIIDSRKGNSGSETQGQVLMLPFGTLIPPSENPIYSC